jgi:hypothetical protein
LYGKLLRELPYRLYWLYGRMLWLYRNLQYGLYVFLQHHVLRQL